MAPRAWGVGSVALPATLAARPELLVDVVFR